MPFRGELLTQARLAKRHYLEPHAGDLFADIEGQLADGAAFRIPRWLPKVFQHILNDFWSLDDLSRTDFLSCLLKLCRKLASDGKSLELQPLKESLGRLPSWDAELAQEVINLETAMA